MLESQYLNNLSIPDYLKWIIEIFIIGMIILLFGEILPKRIAIENSND